MLYTIFILFLLSFTNETITIKKSLNNQCDPISGFNKFDIEADIDEILKEDYSFFYLLNNYFVICSIPKKDNYTEINTNEEEGSSAEDEIPESTQIRLRNLDSKNYNGKCEIDGVIKNETIEGINATIKINEDVKVDEEFKLDLINCINEGEDYEGQLSISFRQLKGFKQIKDNDIIIFMFYGLITNNIKKGYPIIMDVNLVKNGTDEPENVIQKATCILLEDVNGETEPKQGRFNCTISDIPKENEYYTFVFSSSKYIAGIPQDKILLNPFLTEKYIALGKILDYSNSTKIAPSFNPTSINAPNCKNNGTFEIRGTLLSDLNDDINFELTFSNPINITASCSLTKGKKGEEKSIECQTNENIDTNKIIIAQNTILSNKKELLTINKMESTENLNCINGKISAIDKKFQKPILISFRQLNQFMPYNHNKDSYFHFIGVSNQTLPEDKTIKMIVYVIVNGTKTKEEANCTLKSYMPFNSRNPHYGQAEFLCQVETSDKPEDIEIISSDEILGLNEDIEDFQKSPYKTDLKIKETKNEPNLGKVLNFSSLEVLYDLPPMLEISDIDVKNCEKNGKIKIKGKFSKKIDKKFDFKIPLSYPPSSLKCKTPKTEENKTITMNCKIQKEFHNIDKIIIEPRIIRKKHQEVIFVNKFSQKFEKMNCNNYNDLIREKEKNKINANYTFLKTNNVTIIPKGFLFKLFIYALQSSEDSPQSIPITIFYTIRKSKSLRGLEESESEEGEKEIDCANEGQDGKVLKFNCTVDGIDVNNLEELYLDSNEFSGSNPDNSNPLKSNSTDDSLPKVSEFNSTSIDGKKCEDDGEFDINGNLKESKIYNQLKNIEVYYSNPPDSKGVCNFTDTKTIVCQNQDDFEEEYLNINNQPLGSASNETIILRKIKSDKALSCAISSKSLDLDIPEMPINGTEFQNNYFRKQSSRGLGGGTIAAIVIISTLSLIGIGVLIALSKKGIIFSQNPGNRTPVPQISSTTLVN